MDKWKEIWNKKDRVDDIILDSLIKADGFDSGAGSFNLSNWKKYTSEFFEKLKIEKSNSIYDVGCGSGAFVFPLFIKGHEVGGIDYSSVLVELANKMIVNTFENNEAVKIDTNKKYDVVVSHSVFHYFQDLNYAEEVLKRMIEKSNQKVAIFDINDKEKEETYHSVRMGDMDKNDYLEKYKGLEHMFYDKDWFVSIGSKLGLKVTVFDQSFESYSNSKLRFNVIMEK